MRREIAKGHGARAVEFPWCDDFAAARFQAAVEHYRRQERSQRGLPADGVLPRTEQAAMDRAAYRRALVAHDLLLFRPLLTTLWAGVQWRD